MKKINLLFITSLMLSACSFSNSSKEVVTSKPSDELEFTVDTFSEAPAAEIKVEEQKIAETKTPDEILPAEKEPEKELAKPAEKPVDIAEVKPVEGREQAMAAPQEPKFQDYQQDAAPQITPIVAREPTNSTLGREEKYKIQKGDTLMMVAFKIYGDYRKWKDLAAWNKDKIKSKMGPGSELKYYVPEQSFGWHPSGLPYLVKTKDTLGIISMDKYGTSKKWKNIYENNRPLIRNPNLIFAGFTIYYVPVRDIASEPR